ASLRLHFTSLTTAGTSDRYQIAAQWAREAQPTKGEDAKKIGIGAGAGAAIGAIIGGGKGAAIGAAAGGGAGTGVVLATPGKEVTLSSGAVISVKLERDFDVKVPIKNLATPQRRKARPLQFRVSASIGTRPVPDGPPAVLNVVMAPPMDGLPRKTSVLPPAPLGRMNTLLSSSGIVATLEQKSDHVPARRRYISTFER